MKDILNYINESASGIPNRKLSKDNKNEYYDLADEQAQWIIDNYLRKNCPEFEFEIVDSADTKRNLEEGDILAHKDGKTYNIDLKVAEYGENVKYVGTIDLNSILNFANKPNSIYLCCSSNGHTVISCSGKDVWKIFDNNDRILFETKHKNRNVEVKKELEKYSDKIKNYSGNGVSPYDYMPSIPIKGLNVNINSLLK